MESIQQKRLNLKVTLPAIFILQTKATKKNSARGISADESFTINTSGTVNIDVSQVGDYSFGILSLDRNNTITHVGSMFIKYKKGSQGGRAVYPKGAFDDIAANHAININDDKCIATCRYGTPYTVTVTNGTCNAVDTSTGQYLAGDTVTLSPNVPQDGSSFLKWTSEDVDIRIGQIQSLTFTMPDNDVAVRAVYAHTVTFNANGHGTAPAAQTVEVGNTANKPTAPKADGWTFCGWYKDAECTEYFDFSTAITSNITLYAAWTQGNTYTVTFNANGHGTAPDPQIVKEGGKAARPATDPTAEGWIFGGWMKSQSGWGDAYFDFDTETITKDITLYADWAEPYYVYFKANGGTGTMEPVAVYPGDWCTLPECGFTAPEGKCFKGWAFNANSTEVVQFPSFEVTGDKTLYAIWEDITGYTVSGTATSFGSDTDDVTIQLTESGASEASYETVVKGNSASYSIEGVVPGTYTMKVMKKNHVTREYTVTVSSDNVTQDVYLCLLGDVNEDGLLNSADYSMIVAHVKCNVVFDDVQKSAADLTRDGVVDAFDAIYLDLYLNSKVELS